MIQELQANLKKLKQNWQDLQQSSAESDRSLCLEAEQIYRDALAEAWGNLTPSDRVYLARQMGRPNGKAFISALCTDFIEFHGDRVAGDDKTVVAGVAMYHGLPVTVLALCKGANPAEFLHHNYGMANPAGYRKIQRLAKQAEKFGRPILTFIDTPGAYPGIQAEEQGQGEAIASCLALFSDITVPVVATITGEGGSGGALALAVANRVFMLENAVYSILSPEGFATILWKDAKRKEEAASVMGLTAQDLKAQNVIDEVIPEGPGGILENTEEVFQNLDQQIHKALTELGKMNPQVLTKDRYDRFRKFGTVQERPNPFR